MLALRWPPGSDPDLDIPPFGQEVDDELEIPAPPRAGEAYARLAEAVAPQPFAVSEIDQADGFDDDFDMPPPPSVAGPRAGQTVVPLPVRAPPPVIEPNAPDPEELARMKAEWLARSAAAEAAAAVEPSVHEAGSSAPVYEFPTSRDRPEREYEVPISQDRPETEASFVPIEPAVTRDGFKSDIEAAMFGELERFARQDAAAEQALVRAPVEQAPVEPPSVFEEIHAAMLDELDRFENEGRLLVGESPAAFVPPVKATATAAVTRAAPSEPVVDWGRSEERPSQTANWGNVDAKNSGGGSHWDAVEEKTSPVPTWEPTSEKPDVAPEWGPTEERKIVTPEWDVTEEKKIATPEWGATEEKKIAMPDWGVTEEKRIEVPEWGTSTEREDKIVDWGATSERADKVTDWGRSEEKREVQTDWGRSEERREVQTDWGASRERPEPPGRSAVPAAASSVIEPIGPHHDEEIPRPAVHSGEVSLVFSEDATGIEDLEAFYAGSEVETFDAAEFGREIAASLAELIGTPSSGSDLRNRYVTWYDVQGEAATTHIIDPCMIEADGRETPYHAMLSAGPTPERCLEIDTLMIERLKADLTGPALTGGRYMLGLPVAASTLIRPKFRNQYLQAWADVDDLLRQRVRLTAYNLPETSASQASDLFAWMRSLGRAPIVRIPPRVELLAPLGGFGVYSVAINFEKWFHQLGPHAFVRVAMRLMKQGHQHRLRVAMTRLPDKRAVQIALALNADYLEIGTAEAITDLPRQPERLTQAQLLARMER